MSPGRFQAADVPPEALELELDLKPVLRRGWPNLRGFRPKAVNHEDLAVNHEDLALDHEDLALNQEGH